MNKKDIARKMPFNRFRLSFRGRLMEHKKLNRKDTKRFNCWRKLPHAFYSAGISVWNDNAYQPMTAMSDEMLEQV